MKLRISAVGEQGDASKEYLMLSALDDCNLSSYAVVDNTYDSSGKPSNKIRHTFFFPTKQVKKGEWIVLYTKPGVYKLGQTNNDKPLHYFYWGLTNAVWNDTGDTVHLLEISGISKHKLSAKT
ncbi:hypothetical protein HU723_10095 [Pseudomonas lurida]|uniref:hypothetical protein n=1 Tax=Pseudomonas lurida TaxID=244566 RepID=UPI0016441EC0|nr:hypothetical protein [Pseudomonas lurida]MBC3239531.1 hypothetical protein [Pseudomonas lurida]